MEANLSYAVFITCATLAFSAVNSYHILYLYFPYEQYHETINKALDAVQDDGVIVVHSGVYDEQLSISKPVAIIGAGIQYFEKTKY